MTHYHDPLPHRNTPLQNRERKGGFLAWKAQRERLIHFDRGPDGYPSSSFFRFDDGAKLKKRDSGDVSYLKKSVSYLQKVLNQTNTNKKKAVISALFLVRVTSLSSFLWRSPCIPMVTCCSRIGSGG